MPSSHGRFASGLCRFVQGATLMTPKQQELVRSSSVERRPDRRHRRGPVLRAPVRARSRAPAADVRSHRYAGPAQDPDADADRRGKEHRQAGHARPGRRGAWKHFRACRVRSQEPATTPRWVARCSTRSNIGLGDGFTHEVEAAWTEAYEAPRGSDAGRGVDGGAGCLTSARALDAEQLDDLLQAGGERVEVGLGRVDAERGAGGRRQSSRSWSGIVQWWPARMATPYGRAPARRRAGGRPGC